VHRSIHELVVAAFPQRGQRRSSLAISTVAHATDVA
jgi:hypothetical protein